MVLRYTVHWDGGPGGRGYSIFHGRGQTGAPVGTSSQDLANKVHSLFTALRTALPDEITIGFRGEVEDLDTTTGVLTAVHAINAPSPVTGSATGNYAAPAGIRIEWRTPAIVGGRRLKGRTFIVPTGASLFDTDGSLTTSAINTFSNAALGFYDPSVFGNVQPSVWSRTHGVQADITSHRIPDQAAVMRSRRD